MFEVIVAAIVTAVMTAIGTLIGRILIGLLISYVTYTGIDVALSYFHDNFIANMSGIPGDLAGLLGLLKIGTQFNIVSSAITARMILSGLKDGQIKKMKFK